VLLQYNAVDTMVLDELVAATGIEASRRMRVAWLPYELRMLGASVPDVALVPVGGGAGAFCLVRGPCGDARRAAASGLSCRVLRAPRVFAAAVCAP
jgi:hypothetical protein